MLSGQMSGDNLVKTQPPFAASPQSRLRRRLLFACLVLSFVPAAAPAQPATLHSIQTLYVAPLAASEAADAVRTRLIARLKKSSSLRIVDDARSADAILHSDAVIWPTGTVSLNPRSNSVALRNYQGYLSADLSDTSDHPLWSYLVTPSRFRTASIVDDLVDQLSTRLLAAIASGIPGNVPQPSASRSAAVTLHAAGATFPAPLYQLWFRSFQEDLGGVPITYDPIGSSPASRSWPTARSTWPPPTSPPSATPHPRRTSSTSPPWSAESSPSTTSLAKRAT